MAASWSFFLIFAAVWAQGLGQKPVNGQWSPWQVDPDVDCCVYGGVALYKRFCNNPLTENGGTRCKDTNGTSADMEQQWRTCTCACNPTCDNRTAFCANDTGRPAYCSCNFGLIPPPGYDPNNVTSCIVPPSTVAAVTTESPRATIEPSVKDSLKTAGYIIGVIVIVCLSISLVLFIVLRNFAAERIIHMNEEITLLIVYILIVAGSESTTDAGMCKATSILLHYVYLCTLTFFGLEALHTYSMVTYVVPRNGFFTTPINIALGYGLPILPVAISVGVLYGDYGNGGHCWFDLNTDVAWGVFCPLCFAAFMCTVIAEAQGQGKYKPLDETDQPQFTSARISQGSLMIVMPLSLLSYILGLVAVHIQSVAVYALYDVFTILFGFVILFCHAIVSKEVRSFLGKFLPCFKKDAEQTPNTAKVAPSPDPNEEGYEGEQVEEPVEDVAPDPFNPNHGHDMGGTGEIIQNRPGAP